MYDLKDIINHYHAMKSKTARKQSIYLIPHVIACTAKTLNIMCYHSA